MKLTETQLRQIIREELSKLNERGTASPVGYVNTAKGFANTAKSMVWKAEEEIKSIDGVLSQIGATRARREAKSVASEIAKLGPKIEGLLRRIGEIDITGREP